MVFIIKKVVFLRFEIMAIIAQLVRVPDCGSEGRGFEPHLPPGKVRIPSGICTFFICFTIQLILICPVF